MLLRFDADCTEARLEGRCSVEVLSALDRALSFYEPGFRHKYLYKVGRWDGKTYLLDRERLAFPAGLAHRVLATLSSFGVEPEIADERPRQPWTEPPDVPSLHGVTLYDDQREAFEAIVDARAGCLSLPTNAGKTEIAAAVIKASAPFRALVIVDRKGLMAQTRDRLEARLNEPVGVMGGGLKKSRHRVTVATIQTLWRHLPKLTRTFFPEITTLVVDEAHVISPTMWFQTLKRIPAPIRLGLSATIKEASRRLIIEAFLGPIVYEEESIALIEAGRSATPDLAMLRVGSVIDDGDGFAQQYDRGVVFNGTRNRLILDTIQRARQQRLPVLVLVVRIPHGLTLQALCEREGLDVPFLYGQTPLDAIQRAKRDLESGRVPAVIASTIFDLGQDVPNIRVLILAGGQRAPGRMIQRVGRGLRRKPSGDNRVHVLDFYDTGSAMLRKQADERFRTFKRKHYNPRIITSLDEFLPAR